VYKPGCRLVTARIRGIYSTALTRLLLDHSFGIVQPSEAIVERFGLTKRNDSDVQPDLNIHDRMDRQGVIVSGNAGSIEDFLYILKSTLDDAVYRNFLWMRQENIQYNSPESFISDVQTFDVESGELLRLDIEFPGLSKRKMDEIRSSVIPTVAGHHYFKACGGRFSMIVDIAERMLMEGCPRDEVEALLNESIASRFPRVGSTIGLEHVKLNGEIFDLGTAKIMRFNREKGRLVLLRRIFRKGIYDGLEIRKDPGDFAVTEVVIGGLSLRTRYFSRDREYKGTYININTPVELYPSKIRYVDLEVDICVWPNGEIKKIDEEKLREAAAAGLISERLLEISDKEIEKILDLISLDEEREAYLLV